MSTELEAPFCSLKPHRNKRPYDKIGSHHPLGPSMNAPSELHINNKEAHKRISKVGIVDNSVEIREILASFINSVIPYKCVASFASPEDALREFPLIGIRIALVDICLLKISGWELLERLKLSCPGLRVILVTTLPNEEIIRNAISIGVSALLIKPVSRLEMADALHAIPSDGMFLCTKACKVFARKNYDAHEALDLKRPFLTRRELQMLQLIGQGLAYKQVADTLKISIHTVTNTLAAARNKLHAHSTVEALNFAGMR